MATQNKKAATDPVRGPLARKLLTSLRGLMHQKVVDLDAWRDGKRVAEAIDASLIGRDKLGELDPLHGLFIFAQQRLSAWVEQLSALPALRKLTDPVVQAEDEYLPSGPPTSPLTPSYFFCWAALDLTAGPKRESFASITLDLYRQFGVDPAGEPSASSPRRLLSDRPREESSAGELSRSGRHAHSYSKSSSATPPASRLRRLRARP